MQSAGTVHDVEMRVGVCCLMSWILTMNKTRSVVTLYIRSSLDIGGDNEARCGKINAVGYTKTMNKE